MFLKMPGILLLDIATMSYNQISVVIDNFILIFSVLGLIILKNIQAIILCLCWKTLVKIYEIVKRFTLLK